MKQHLSQVPHHSPRRSRRVLVEGAITAPEDAMELCERGELLATHSSLRLRR